jgi:hypothetical protein
VDILDLIWDNTAGYSSCPVGSKEHIVAGDLLLERDVTCAEAESLALYTVGETNNDVSKRDGRCQVDQGSQGALAKWVPLAAVGWCRNGG